MYTHLEFDGDPEEVEGCKCESSSSATGFAPFLLRPPRDFDFAGFGVAEELLLSAGLLGCFLAAS